MAERAGLQDYTQLAECLPSRTWDCLLDAERSFAEKADVLAGRVRPAGGSAVSRGGCDGAFRSAIWRLGTSETCPAFVSRRTQGQRPCLVSRVTRLSRSISIIMRRAQNVSGGRVSRCLALSRVCPARDSRSFFFSKVYERAPPQRAQVLIYIGVHRQADTRVPRLAPWQQRQH